MGFNGPTGDHAVPGVSIPYSVKYTSAQIYALLMANGASADTALNLTRIATREDGSGTVNIVNDNPAPYPAGSGDYSVGFFQLNFANGSGGVSPSRTFAQGVTYTYQELAADPNKQARAAIALWNNGNGSGNWRPVIGGVPQPWTTGTDLGRAQSAASTVGSNFISVANGALALVGLPPIDPSVPPTNPPSSNSSGTTDPGTGGGQGDGGSGDGTSGTTNTSGLGPGMVQLGSVAGQPIAIPSGMVLAALAVVLLLIGAILFLANNQTVKVDAVKGVTANPAVQAATKVIP